MARRIRWVGVLVLAAGLLTAGRIWWVERHRTEPTIEEVLPGTAARNSRQMGILYGPIVQAVWDFYQELQQPYTEAPLVAVASLIVMIGCFRLAQSHEPHAGV